MPNVLLKKTKIKKKRSGLNNFKNSRGVVHNRELSTGTYPFTVWENEISIKISSLLMRKKISKEIVESFESIQRYAKEINVLMYGRCIKLEASTVSIIATIKFVEVDTEFHWISHFVNVIHMLCWHLFLLPMLPTLIYYDLGNVLYSYHQMYLAKQTWKYFVQHHHHPYCTEKRQTQVEQIIYWPNDISSGLTELRVNQNELNISLISTYTAIRIHLENDVKLQNKMVDIWLTEWRVDGKKNDCWPKKKKIKFLYVL